MSDRLIADAAREYVRVRHEHEQRGPLLSQRKAAHDALVALVEAERPDPDAWSYCTRGPCAAEDGHAGTCAEASGWADEPGLPTWDDIEWERAQCERRIAEVRSLAEVAIDRERRIDAASRTVADRVWRAAMERRKVLRVADLIEGVERVIV